MKKPKTRHEILVKRLDTVVRALILECGPDATVGELATAIILVTQARGDVDDVPTVREENEVTDKEVENSDQGASGG